MKFADIEKLESYVEQGYLTKRPHPTLPLFVYNYTDKTTWEKKWDDVTIMCRGLVLDKEYNIIARPFKKFFNQGETEEVREFPNEPCEATIKLDGSLGIAFKYNDNYIVSTRGSFESEQSKWATDYFNENGYSDPTYKAFLPEYTYLFEIIYKANKIIVDYDYQGLVLIGMVNIETGDEMPYNMLFNEAERLKIRVVDPIIGKTPIELIERANSLPASKSEGFVLWFPESQLRIKIKGEQYRKLAKFISNLSPLALWESMESGKVRDAFYNDCPIEFLGMAKEIGNKLEEQYADLLTRIRHCWDSIPIETKRGPRKDFALYVKDQYGGRMGYMFRYLDFKPMNDMLMKEIRPTKNIINGFDILGQKKEEV